MKRFDEVGVLGIGAEILVLGIDDDLGEPCLVVDPPQLRSAVGVCGGAVGDEGERAPEDLLLARRGRGDLPAAIFKRSELAGELLLLVTGDVGRDNALHGLLRPLEALPLDLVDLLLVAALFLVGLGLDGAQLIDEAVLDLGQPLRLPSGLFAAPGAEDGFLDLVEW